MFTLWPLVAHDRNHSINIMAKRHAHDCYSHGHCTCRDRMLSLARMCVCVCLLDLFNTSTIHVSVILKSLRSFTSYYSLHFFFTFTVLKKNFLKHAGWSSHTHALENSLVVVSFSQPKYCWKILYSPLMQSISYSPALLTNQPKMHTLFL